MKKVTWERWKPFFGSRLLFATYPTVIMTTTIASLIMTMINNTMTTMMTMMATMLMAMMAMSTLMMIINDNDG